MKEQEWILEVAFDSIEYQIWEKTYEGGIGDAAKFYAYVREWWSGLLPEELDECTELKGDNVTVTTDALDTLVEPMHWVLMHTVPRRMVLKHFDGESETEYVERKTREEGA
jgi:hypothetical protein